MVRNWWTHSNKFPVQIKSKNQKSANDSEKTGDPQGTPYQQQSHNVVHKFIMAAVEVLQNVSCKSPDQVSESTKEHQI